jgi:hypothetical protein
MLWHIFWKSGLWSQQRRQLLGNNTVKTRDPVFSVLSTPIHTPATMEELLETAFYMRYTPWLHKESILRSVRGACWELSVEFGGWHLEVSSSRELAAEGSTSQSMRLAWDGRHPARVWARKHSNVRRWKLLPRNWLRHKSVRDSDLWNVVASCKNVQ